LHVCILFLYFPKCTCSNLCWIHSLNPSFSIAAYMKIQ
jgi:hypothetical protein